MQLINSDSASSPTLVNITQVDNSIPKNRYVVHYEIPVFAGMYKSIDDIRELLITAKVLRFKILDLEAPTSPPIYKSAIVQFLNGTNLNINLKFTQGGINLKGTVINSTNQDGVVFGLKVVDISGYLNFLKFREKYRTLENITRKQIFKLDHRLKITDEPNIFYFSLQQSDQSQYFFTNRKLTVQVQQVYSIEDFKTVQVIFEDTINLSQAESSMTAIINIMQKLKISLGVEMIRNRNFASNQIASLRVLELSYKCNKISIGTDKVGELATVKPLLQDIYYDYEFGYLNQNLRQMQNTNIYEHISKLTKSFPIYPHFQNSKIIDINAAKFIVFSFTNSKNRPQSIRIPFVYILQGVNVIQSQNTTIKFYIEFSGQVSEGLVEKAGDDHKIFEFRIKDIWNLGQVCQKYRDIVLKMVTPGINYYIPFISAEVDTNSFKKQAKQLQLKSQYGELNLNKYYLLTTSPQQNKLLLTKTQSINEFYLMDLFNSSSLTFQITSQDDIVLQGTILREKVVKSGSIIKVILSSSDSLLKTVLIFQSNLIKQNNYSLRTDYSFLYRLEFTDNVPCNHIQYDLQLKRITDNKKYKTKITPEISDDGVSTLHTVEAQFFESTEADMELGLTVRKMYYNDETQVFDNSEAIFKKIYINPSATHLLQKNCLFVTIKKQGYSSLEFDFYDENIKKRLKLHLEICMKKLPIFDQDPGKYIIKIPQYLWRLNKFGDGIQSITMETYLTSKKRRGNKIIIFPDSPQEYTLPHRNYKDGCSITINGEIGYDKMIDAMKIRCDVTNQGIGWLEQSQWYLGIINVGSKAFHFLVKYSFDANADDNQEDHSEDSEDSQKTAAKKQSQRSYSGKIDKLAKTVSNMELFKLKQYRNTVVDQGRKLTTNYVKRQTMIANIQKKIQDFDYKILKAKQMHKQTNQKKQQEASLPPEANPNKKQKGSQKMKSFYRSICQCGYKNPQFNGYCQSCLKTLKKRYQIFFKQYKQKSYEYERICFNKFNVKQKYLKAKNKLRHYKARLREGLDIEDNGIGDVITYLEQGDLKRQIQQNKIQIFRLQQQRQRLQNSSKQRMDALQAMIRKQDEQIWSNTGEMEQLNQKLRQLHLKIDNNSQGHI